jgi:lipoprotein-releasing system ATP-binding protein
MADFSASEITKEFDTPTGPLRILDGVSVELNRGENLAVVGESGSGKSTFLHIAGTLDKPTAGQIELLGQNPFQLDDQQLAEFRNENLGFVFQQHHLLPQLSALENVLIPVIAERTASGQDVALARSLLERVGLADRMDHRPGVLSGGERQRVAVARALVREPVLLLADEPTGSLDQKNAESIGQMLLDIQGQTSTILICVTHSDRLAEKFARQVRLEHGKFV